MTTLTHKLDHSFILPIITISIVVIAIVTFWICSNATLLQHATQF